MKKITLFLFAFTCSSLLFAQKKARVNGSFTGERVGEEVLLRYTSDGEVHTDTASVKDKTFQFSPAIKRPVLAQMRIKYAAADTSSKPVFELRQLYIQPGKTDISISDSLNKAVIKGGRAQKDFQTLSDLAKPFAEKQNELVERYNEYAKAQDKEALARINEEFQALDSARKHDVYLNFVRKNKKSPIALYALQTYAGYDINTSEVEPVFNALPNKLKKTEEGKAFSDRLDIAKKTALGAIAMDFTQNDTNDVPVNLKDFRGKYVLIDFWASWCGPCRVENPNVVRAFEKYKDKNFTVLGISLDREGQKQAWMDAIHRDNLTWTHVSDLKFWDNAVAKQYGIRAIPQNLLIDPSGKIIAKNIRGEELHTKLSEFLD